MQIPSIALLSVTTYDFIALDSSLYIFTSGPPPEKIFRKEWLPYRIVPILWALMIIVARYRASY